MIHLCNKFHISVWSYYRLQAGRRRKFFARSPYCYFAFYGIKIVTEGERFWQYIYIFFPYSISRFDSKWCLCGCHLTRRHIHRVVIVTNRVKLQNPKLGWPPLSRCSYQVLWMSVSWFRIWNGHTHTHTDNIEGTCDRKWQFKYRSTGFILLFP